MQMQQYKQVLQQPGAAGVLILGFLARIPFSMGVLLTMHVVFTLGHSYLDAGVVVTASTIGSAISSPWRGRLVDKHGLRRAMLPTVIIESLVWAVAPWASFYWLIPLSFIGGLFSLPVWSVIRVALSILVPAHLRRSAYALDSVATEFVFMIGPATITALAIGIGTRPSMMIVGGLIALSGLGMMWFNPPTRSSQLMIPAKLDPSLDAMESAVLSLADDLGEKTAQENQEVTSPAQKQLARRGLLRPAGISILVAAAVGNLIIMGTDVSVVALLKDLDQGSMIGLVMAGWCLGSAIGGITFGAMNRVINPLYVLLLLGAVTVPIMFASSVISMMALTFIAGFGCAPILASTGEAISYLVPEESRGEAMGWHGSALTVGGAIGAPFIGLIIDTYGSAWGFGVCGIIGIVVAIGGLIATRLHRLRVRKRIAATDGMV